MILLFVLLTLAVLSSSQAQALEVLRACSPTTGEAQLILETSAPATYEEVSGGDPKHFSLDIPEARLALVRRPNFPLSSPIRDLRFYDLPGVGLRVSFALRRPTEYAISAPDQSGDYGHRLVISFPQSETPIASSGCALRSPFRVLIDPGHGGKDSGSEYPDRNPTVVEKVITRNISQRLWRKLQGWPGVIALMTSDTDSESRSAKKRAPLVRKMQADILISIHADESDRADNPARGIHVFTLKRKFTSDVIKRDRREGRFPQRAGEIFGASPDDEIARRSEERSDQLAKFVLDSLSQAANAVFTPEIRGPPSKEPLAMLKSFEVPSIMVEVGFINHPEEGRRLMATGYQDKLAAALAKGIRNYVDEVIGSRPDTMLYALQRKQPRTVHILQPGESPMTVASDRGLSLSSLLPFNGVSLVKRRSAVGQMLILPLPEER